MTNLTGKHAVKSIIIGPFYHSLSLSNLEYQSNACIAISSTGSILAVKTSQIEDFVSEHAEAQIIRLKEGQFLIPGFIDSNYN